MGASITIEGNSVTLNQAKELIGDKFTEELQVKFIKLSSNENENETSADTEASLSLGTLKAEFQEFFSDESLPQPPPTATTETPTIDQETTVSTSNTNPTFLVSVDGSDGAHKSFNLAALYGNSKPSRLNILHVSDTKDYLPGEYYVVV